MSNQRRPPQDPHRPCERVWLRVPKQQTYDGLSATYDYGPYGAELKNNIRQYWWAAMTKLDKNIVGFDAAIFMHPTVWKASGHVDALNDPLIDNKDSKKRYRADVLLEEHIAKYPDKIEKETEKAKKKFGEAFNKEQFRATNPNVLRAQERMNAVEGRMKTALEANDLEAVRQFIIDRRSSTRSAARRTGRRCASST